MEKTSVYLTPRQSTTSSIYGPLSPITPAPDSDYAETTLSSISFNHDTGGFACATDLGFRLYSSNPLGGRFRRYYCYGGIGIVEFHNKTLAFVGAEENPEYPPNRVMIWDDRQNECVNQISFSSNVKAVKLSMDRMVVVLEKRIYVYKVEGLTCLQKIKTRSNPKGIFAVSQASDSCVVAYPALDRGNVCVKHFGVEETNIISAHNSRLACLSLSPDGKNLATASVKGTLVRIFSSLDGTCLHEVRRGTDQAHIHSIAFSRSTEWLAVSSDKGTLHVFDLKVQEGGEVPSKMYANCKQQLPVESDPSPPASPRKSNTNPSFSLLKFLPKYFSSRRSFAQFHLPAKTKFNVEFGAKKNKIVVIGLNGSFYRCKFDPVNGGKMEQVDYAKFFEV